jgi:uncharacterized protein
MKTSIKSPSGYPVEMARRVRIPGSASEIQKISLIARIIKETGFSCTRCGGCCRPDSPDSNQVMVTAKDLHAISEVSGLSREDFCDPFPGAVCVGKDLTCTFNWELRRNGNGCIFLSGTLCTVYPARPWICRTYPFQLAEGGKLEVFPCPGIGQEISESEAEKMAGLLIERYLAESEEEIAIRKMLASRTIPDSGHFVADSEGITPVRQE